MDKEDHMSLLELDQAEKEIYMELGLDGEDDFEKLALPLVSKWADLPDGPQIHGLEVPVMKDDNLITDSMFRDDILYGTGNDPVFDLEPDPPDPLFHLLQTLDRSSSLKNKLMERHAELLEWRASVLNQAKALEQQGGSSFQADAKADTLAPLADEYLRRAREREEKVKVLRRMATSYNQRVEAFGERLRYFSESYNKHRAAAATRHKD